MTDIEPLLSPVACVVCTHDLTATEMQTCQRCLSAIRLGLLRIETLFALLPSVLANLGAASALDSVLARGGDEATLPGGDILVMLGPGSDGGAGHPADPPAIAFELRHWAKFWSESRQENPRKAPYKVPALVDWLSVRAGWAADHHPAFAHFASDVRRIVARLEDVTDTSDRPERGVSCPYCGVDLLRWATDEGYPDDWECLRCQKAFNPGQYAIAVRAHREAESTRETA